MIETRDPTKLIKRLRERSTTLEIAMESILLLKILPLSREQEVVLNPILWEFIHAYRHRGEREIRTSVTRSISLYVAGMAAIDLPQLAEILGSDYEPEILSEIELTVSKVVVRKITANLPPLFLPGNALELCFVKMVQEYMNDNKIDVKQKGAIVLNALTALIMMDYSGISGMIEVMNSMECAWFSGIVVSRMKRVKKEISNRKGLAGKYISRFDSFVESVKIKKCENDKPDQVERVREMGKTT